MNKITLIILLLFFSNSFLFSQGGNPGDFFGTNQLLSGNRFAFKNRSINNRITELKGSPLLFKNFENKGKIILTSGSEYKINNINIDLYNGLFISEVEKDSIFIYNKISYAKINSRIYTQNDNEIFEVLLKKDESLFLKKIYKIKKRQVQNKITAESINWKLKEEYYFQINGNFEKIKFKRKELKKFLKNRDLLKVNKFIKSNHLSLNIEKDLIIIVNYYFSIKNT